MDTIIRTTVICRARPPAVHIAEYGSLGMRANGESPVLCPCVGSAVRNGPRWQPVLVIPLAVLFGCELSAIPSTSGMRVLATTELDRITVGSAGASIDLAARGVLKLKPLVTHVLSLSDLESAIGMLESDEDRRMKIILENPG